MSLSHVIWSLSLHPPILALNSQLTMVQPSCHQPFRPKTPSVFPSWAIFTSVFFCLKCSCVFSTLVFSGQVSTQKTLPQKSFLISLSKLATYGSHSSVPHGFFLSAHKLLKGKNRNKNNNPFLHHV